MLINCVAYENGSKLADIPIAEISDYLARPDCFVWVALKDAGEEELATMQEEFHLHELAIEDALHGHQRPKVEEYGDTLFAVLHTVELSPTDEIVTGELNIFVGLNFVLSVRNRSRQSLLQVRGRAEREPHMLRHGPAFVFYALMDAVVDRYFPIIDSLETELEAVEDQIFEPGTSQANIQRLYGLKRDIGIVRHAVTPLIDAVLSADTLRQYKIRPAVYALALQRFPQWQARDVLFVSSNAWDALGATWFGFDTLWIDRKGLPPETLGPPPRHMGTDLRAVLGVVS